MYWIRNRWQSYNRFPTTGLLEKAKPVFEVLPGWKSDIRGIKNYDDLPENCRKYIEFVEKQDRIPDHNDLQWTRKK